MKLVEFLLHNWYVALVAIFLLSGFLRRAKSGADNAPRTHAPKQAMPPFGGGGGSGWGRDTTPTITTTKQLPGPRKELIKSGNMTPERRPHQPFADSRSLDRQEEVDFWEDTAISSSRPAASVSQGQLRLFRTASSPSQQERLDAERLAQGIIWAEILGPPRAKKPFRR